MLTVINNTMTSVLTTAEFEIQLGALTKSGDPTLMGIPFVFLAINNSSRPFYGQIASGRFQVTRNSFLFPTPFIINGTFKESKSGTEVNYKIEPIWFGYLWIRIFPVLAFFLMNFLLIKGTKTLILELMIPINIVLLIMFLPILITNRLKIRMERDFIQDLKIDR